MRHRPRVVIYVEILAELRGRPSGPTRVSRVANLSYDKCVEFLGALEARGLVARETSDGHVIYRTTPEGYRLVEDWESVWRRLMP